MHKKSSLRANLKQLFPRPLTNFLGNASGDIKDLRSRVSGNRPPQPSRVLYNLGVEDYHETGRAIADEIAAQTGLEPNWSVLDIGCGTGRVAAPLVRKLDGRGSYIGFDVSIRAVTWARRHISGFGTPVRFFSFDIANAVYNPRGRRLAQELSFPVLSESVDLCVAVALFPHLRADTARYYLQEAARVLKPGGKLFLTAYLFDDAAQSVIATGQVQTPYQPISETEWTKDRKTPEYAMAFSESAFLDWASGAGLSVLGSVQRGSRADAAISDRAPDTIVLQKMTSQPSL